MPNYSRRRAVGTCILAIILLIFPHVIVDTTTRVGDSSRPLYWFSYGIRGGFYSSVLACITCWIVWTEGPTYRRICVGIGMLLCFLTGEFVATWISHREITVLTVVFLFDWVSSAATAGALVVAFGLLRSFRLVDYPWSHGKKVRRWSIADLLVMSALLAMQLSLSRARAALQDTDADHVVSSLTGSFTIAIAILAVAYAWTTRSTLHRVVEVLAAVALIVILRQLSIRYNLGWHFDEYFLNLATWVDLSFAAILLAVLSMQVGLWHWQGYRVR